MKDRNPENKKRRCVSCNRPIEGESLFFPFCSERCRLLDLGHWLKGDYRIPAPKEVRIEEEEEQGAEARCTDRAKNWK